VHLLLLGLLFLLRSQNQTDVTHFVTWTVENSEQDMHCIQDFVGRIVVFSFSSYEAVRLLPMMHVRNKMCSNDPDSEDDLQKAIRM